MLGILPPDNTGRTGLWKIQVTPLLYLMLLDKLKSGRKVTYSKTELQVAFKNYLEKNKGPWKPDQIKTLAGLDKFASEHVEKQKEKFEAERKKDAKSGVKKSPSKMREKENLLLKKLGLLPPDEKDLPVGLRGAKNVPEAEPEAIRNIRYAEQLSSAMDLIAMTGEPMTIVAVTLIIVGMQKTLVNKACDKLLDVYEKKAQNSPEKSILLRGMSRLMGPAQRLMHQEKIRHIGAREQEPEFQKEIQKLEPSENDVSVEQKHAAFRENVTSMEKQRYTTPTSTARRNDPFAVPMHPKGPVVISDEYRRRTDQT